MVATPKWIPDRPDAETLPPPPAWAGRPDGRRDGKCVPDYPFYPSGDDDPVRVRHSPCAGVSQALGQGIQLVAAVEAPSEAGQVALGVFGANVMVGAGERRLDVAERGVDPGERGP